MKNTLLTILDIVLRTLTRRFLVQMRKNTNVMKVIRLYGNNKFVPIRFWDAPFVEVEKLIARKGKIIDVGCGEGIFTNFLALSAKDRTIIGIDIDKDRIKDADKDLPNVAFKSEDVVKAKIPKCDNIILFHLLHHLNSFNDQIRVLNKCFKSLNKGGKLIIVEVDIKPSIKYLVSWFTDCFIVPWLFEKRLYAPVHYRSRHEWTRLIESFGYFCAIRAAEKNKPFTHIIIVCEKLGNSKTY